MHTHLRSLIAFCILSGTAPLGLAASVSITAAHPERFTDIGTLTNDSAANMRELTRIITQQGQRYLPAQQTLKVELLDVDLAGRERMIGRMANEVRVINGRADWPSIHLRYTLEEGGRVLQQGEETLVDLNYTQRTGDYRSQNRLPYEERMLGDWMRARFVEHKPGPQAKNP